MGTSHSSIPAPLVEVSAPGGRVLVPPYTQFSVHPPRHGDPVYRPSPLRRGRRPRRPRPDYVIGVEDDDGFGSESEFGGMDGMGMRGGGFGGRGGFRGMPGGRGGGTGMGMGMGRGVASPFEIDGRPRSAPERGMGGFPGMGMGPGMGGMGPHGMAPHGMGGMGPPGGMPGPGMGGMGPPGGMGPMGPPPGYSLMQSMPQYEPPRGGMPGGDRFPHSGGPMSEASSTAAPSEKPMRGPSRRQSGGNTRVPMGAFAKAAKSPQLSRSRTEPTTADRLNRGQADGTRVGSSGHEWLKGNDFLDACMCTTGCTCRKGHRVLYRSRDDPARSDSEYEAGPRYTSGEIRYVLGSKLGQDCGDHSGCKKKSSSSSSESEGEAKRRKKKEEKKQKKQFQGLKEDVLEAIDQKLDAIKKARSGKASSLGSPRPPFAGLGVAPNAFGMGDPTAMDPLMAQKLGMGNMGMPMSANPYAMGMQGMGKLPPGMMDPMSGRQMRPGQMPMAGMGFENDMSMGDMEGMAMGNPYLGGGMKSRGMQARFMSPGRRKDVDPMAFYTRAGGRGGLMGNRIPRDPRRRRFGNDDFEVPGGRLGLKNRGNGRGGGIGDGAGDALGRDDDDDMMAATHRGSPSGARNPGRNSDRERGRNARAETDDDDEY